MEKIQSPPKVRIQGQDREVYRKHPDPERIRLYYEYCEDHFHRGQDYNLIVEKFSRIVSCEQTEKGLRLSMQGEVLYNTQIDSDGELRPIVMRDRLGEVFQGWITIELYEDHIFRIMAGKGKSPVEHNTAMTEGVTFPRTSSFQIVETPESLWLLTAKCKLEIKRDPYQIRLLDLFDQPICSQENQDQVMHFTHESFPHGFVNNPQTGERIGCLSMKFGHKERYFGLGEQFSTPDKTGQEVDIFVTDPISCAGARTYVPVPFYWSTRGYGIYVNTHYRTKFFMGNRSNRAVSCHIYGDEIIDYFMFYGESPKDLLKGYTDITGKTPMVPKWSFGLWMSRCPYKTQDEVEQVARAMNEHDIPVDVINVDTDWFEHPWACDWKFGSRFSEPSRMVETLQNEGIQVCLWQKPYITAEHLPELLEWMDKQGWLPHNKFGELARSNPVLDMSHPEAKAWYKEQLKALFALGIKAIKTDMGEGVPLEADYFGFTGPEMRNIYTYLYNQAAYEATMEAHGEGLVWARSGYAGSQKYPIHWSGDPFCTFDGLRFSIRSGLSLGLSGFTFWSQDIGGFIGRPSPELYIRWAQAGLFGSHSRCHGGANPREPWTFGEEAEVIFRKYDKLRYRLIPYIYSQAYICTQSGQPMAAHLVLSNPKDPMTYGIDDQWMFGDSLMVAPVVEEGTSREVYLPQGDWYEYRSNNLFPGRQTVTISAPLDTLPLFVPAGGVLLYGEERNHIQGEGEKELVISIYHRAFGKKTVQYYNGQIFAFEIAFYESGATVVIPALPCPCTLELITPSGYVRQAGYPGRQNIAITSFL